MSVAVRPAPDTDCQLCPRLAAMRAENRRKFPAWHNAPVPSFGPITAKLVIAGLAPGLRGANATGRPFTGDWAGDLLYDTLLKFGLARGEYKERADDGLELVDTRIINAVRCVPPGNHPTPEEARTCRRFFIAELAEMPNLTAILALGGIAHDAVLAARGIPRSRFGFAHGARHALPGGPILVDSYHCSRLNTNTGRLTAPMFEAVVKEAMQEAGL